MRIAQIAQLAESVPPEKYGGTERVLHWLTEGLVERGHDVTLFATADSKTKARLIPVVPRGLRHDDGFMFDKTGFHFLMLERVLKMAPEFDIIHFHSDYWHLPYVRLMGTPSLTTTHARLDYLPLASIYEQFPDFAVVSISNEQRKPIPWLNWQGTIYHGLPKNQYHLDENPSDYIVYLGRLCPEKRPDRAIAIARQGKMHLKIAAKVDPADRHYFRDEIEPLLDGEYVEFIGEVDDTQKQDLLGKAKALIHPVEFPEPFGIVMIEAMACGTPTVGYRTGSIPEVIDEGLTGFVVEDIPSAIEALNKVSQLNRRQIREVFDRRFTSERMVDDYIKIYERLIANNGNGSVVNDSNILPGLETILATQ